RREDPRYRQQARPEALLPPLRISRWPSQPDAPRPARAAADRGAPQGGQGHAPAEQAGERPDRQAEDLRRPRASSLGAEPRALEAGDQVSELATYRGTGKRKTSVARVILRPGDGATWFNGRTLEDYFPRASHRNQVMAPLRVAGLEGTYDLRVRVHGGGAPGHAPALPPPVS